jgi:hypothetical protein
MKRLFSLVCISGTICCKGRHLHQLLLNIIIQKFNCAIGHSCFGNRNPGEGWQLVTLVTPNSSHSELLHEKDYPY